MNSAAKPWTTFFLDTNSVWGIMDTREKWEEAKAAWCKHQAGRTPEELKDCLGMPQEHQLRRTMFKFGYVVECTGPGTLGEFFEQRNMEW